MSSGRVIAWLTMSLDGYVAGPNDAVGLGLGEGGERLHEWMFGGPSGEADEVDRGYFERIVAAEGAVIGGRTMFDLAEAWGGSNPFPVPMFVLTHRPEEQPPTGGFTFVASLDDALQRARAAAEDRAVGIVGGASIVRQALAAGVVDELWLTIAPVILGGGKRLFEGFDTDLELAPIATLHSPVATHVTYRVTRPAG